MIAKMPYFLKNKEWYIADIEHTDEKGRGLRLTKEGKRHRRVVKSYEAFYAKEEEDD